MSGIYTDVGAASGRRTRVFRDAPDGSGVEWMYAADRAAGDVRWYAFHPGLGDSVAAMIEGGMALTPIEQAEHLA